MNWVKDLETKQERKRVVCYGSGRNRDMAVVKNRNMQLIQDNIYIFSSVNGEYDIFIYYEKYRIGLYLDTISDSYTWNREELISKVKNIKINTPEEFITCLDAISNGHFFIQNTFILLSSLLAPTKAKRYQEAKEKFLLMKNSLKNSYV